MAPLDVPAHDRSDLLRHAASVRMESQLLREAIRETRERSLRTCARTQMLIEQAGDATRRREAAKAAQNGSFIER